MAEGAVAEGAVAEGATTSTPAMAAASRPFARLNGPYGRPVHPLLAMIAVGTWACSVVFDLIAFRADAAWIYTRAAYLLIGVGLAVGFLAALVGLFDLFTVERATRAFRTGVQHLLVMVVTLGLLAGSWLLRGDSGFAWHDRAPTSALVLSGLGLVTMVVGGWLGAKLAFGYGVRVALDEDRRAGYEPA